MIDTLPPSPTSQTLRTSYYGSLVPDDLLVQLLAQFKSEETREEAFATIVEILDHSVLNTIVTYLEDHESKIAFLELLRDEYNTPHPLEWSILKFADASEVVKEMIERSLLAMHSAINSKL